MAELYTNTPWASGDRLSEYLEQYLPEEYIVLSDITVHELTLDALLVGPQGLFVLHCKGWEGEVHPAQQGPWRERLIGGREILHGNPAAEARKAAKAVRGFLADEFPSLNPAIHHLVVLTDPSAQLQNAERAVPPAVAMSGVAAAITETVLSKGAPALDLDTRETLAQALSERRLTVSQRAAEPFVMRPARRFRPQRVVWTVRAAIRYMDQHPEEGVARLLDGSLADWLSAQGAQHVAKLARDAVLKADLEPRDTLERFLIDTGLVAPPRLVVRPRRLDMGYVLAGQSSCRPLHLKRGQGRGHLFGSMGCSSPWLRVQPAWFSGGPVHAKVTATAHDLPADGKPARASILVHSSASTEPAEVPVQLRVTAAPSRVDRGLLRPLTAMFVAALLGAALGWAVGQWGVLAPRALRALATPPLASTWVWMALVGLPLAVLGWIRGRSQPTAWPTMYALRRWLLCVLGWGVLIALLAVGGRWLWLRLGQGTAGALLDERSLSLVLLAFAAALFPASATPTLVDLPGDAEENGRGNHARRWLRPAMASVLLAAILLAGIQLLGPGGKIDLEQTVSIARQWTQQQWLRLETSISDDVDQFYIRLYDRRAPLQPTPGPNATPATSQLGRGTLQKEK